VVSSSASFRCASRRSGAAACFATLLAYLKADDHVLVPDNVYGPVRGFCNGFLERFGVHSTFYDPLIGEGIAGLVRDNTRVIYLESPGSLTFEIQDVPAIVAVAKGRGIVTMLDNTWAAPLFLNQNGSPKLLLVGCRAICSPRQMDRMRC